MTCESYDGPGYDVTPPGVHADVTRLTDQVWPLVQLYAPTSNRFSLADVTCVLAKTVPKPSNFRYDAALMDAPPSDVPTFRVVLPELLPGFWVFRGS
jgi:hypothetical protein